MADFHRTASAVWNGTGPDGHGTLSGPSGVLDQTPYSARARFQNEDGKAGTNPEELVAAAHAGCFSMALAFQLTNAGHPPVEVTTRATMHMERQDKGWTAVGIRLEVTGRVPGLAEARFAELAEAAKGGCPISRALAAVPITLSAVLQA